MGRRCKAHDLRRRWRGAIERNGHGRDAIGRELVVRESAAVRAPCGRREPRGRLGDRYRRAIRIHSLHHEAVRLPLCKAREGQHLAVSRPFRPAGAVGRGQPTGRSASHVIDQDEIIRVAHLNRETPTVGGEVERSVNPRLHRQELGLALPADPCERGHRDIATRHIRQRVVRYGQLQVRIERMHAHV